MAIRFIKSGSIAHDIEEVFKDANGVVNPGISGEVYRKLEDLGDAGQKRMYEQQRGELGMQKELELAAKTIITGGKVCAIEYNEGEKKFTIFALDKKYDDEQKIKTVQESYKTQRKKGDSDFSQATFEIVDMTGENYGQNVNNTTVVRKTRKDGSSGLINLPRSTAEIRMFRKDLESRYGKGEQKKTGQRKGILESASSFAKREIDRVYNDKASGAKSEFKKDATVKGRGKEFAVQNYVDYSRVNMTPALKSLAFVYGIEETEETVLWELAVSIARVKDRKKAIDDAMANPVFKNLTKDRQKFKKMANEIKAWAEEYHAEDYDWSLVNEGAANTGVVGVSRSARNVAYAGNRGEVARVQYLQQILHKAKKDPKKEIFSQSVYRSSDAEKKAGIERGREVKPGEYVPFDAVVKGLEVNAFDPRVKSGHALLDNIVVSSELLASMAGERDFGIKIKAKDAKEKLDKIVKKLSKNKERKYDTLTDEKGNFIRYTTSTGKNAKGVLFSELLGGKTEFKDLPPELQQIVLEEAWRQGAKKKNRDVTLSDELRNNIQYKTTDNGGYIIYGTEFVRPREGDKTIAYGVNAKGSAETGDETLKKFNKNGEGYQFLVSQGKGDVRKLGAAYIDTDLNALLYEYGSVLGQHKGIGFNGLRGFLDSIINSPNEKEGTIEAAKAIREAYQFTADGGVILNKSVMDILGGLDPDKQINALMELLPLIDRLINGIDKNNQLIDQQTFESKSEAERYYKRAVDVNGEEVLLRTMMAKTVFGNIHRPNEYQWSGTNLYSGRESIKRNAGLTIAEAGRTDAEKDQIKKGAEELYKRIDVSEKKRSEFETLKRDAENAKRLTNQTTSGVKSGQIDGEDEYIVVIGKGVDPSDDFSIDISDIEEAKYDGDMLLNEDRVLQGVISKKLEKLAEKGIDISKVNFAIDTGTNFGGVTADGRTWGGKGVVLPKGMTLDSDKGFENYGLEAQRLVNMINDSAEEEKIAEKAKEVMLTTQQDFQNKGAVYDRFFGGKTKGVKAGKVLPMPLEWLQNAFANQDNLSELEKWQGEMATSGAFISGSMFDDSVKKLSKTELQELYKKFYDGTGLGGDVTKLSKSKLKEGIKEAVTYSTDQNSVFMQLLNAGKLETGLQALTSRLPFSNGLDIKSLKKVFVQKGLDFQGHKSNTMRLNFGYSRMFNGDYDGDVIEMLIGTKLSDNEKAAINAMGTSDEETAKLLAYLWYKDMAKDAGFELDKQTGQLKQKGGVKVVDQATLRNIFDENMRLVASTGMRYSKTHTGKLSNLATEFRNMMDAKGFDESALLDSDSPEKRKQAAQTMMGRAYLESLEQDSISSKKIIERIIKIKSGKSDLSRMSEDERYKYYSEAVGDIDKILEQFYSGKINFTDLNKTLSTMGVLDEEGNLESGRVLQQYLKKLSRMEGGEDIIAELLGVEKSSLDFKNVDADNYFATQKLKANQIEKIFSSIATFSGFSNSQQLLASLPKKEYSPEKKTVKEYNLATEDVKKADAAWLEHIKTLNNAEAASVSEANAESRKIIIAGKEADAIRLLGAEYQNLSNILGEVSKSKDELAEELLNVDKNSYPATGITAQLHKQFGVTFPDNTTGFGQSVSDFAKKGEVYINGAKYSLKNFKAGFPQDRKDRIWLDSEGNEVKNKTLIGTLNRLGYSKEDFEKNTETFGALDYGTLAHRTSEMLNILGISEKNLKDAKVKDWKGFKDYIENEISRLEQSSNDKDKALGKEARDKWTQGFDDKGYGGSWNDYIKRYNEGLKLIGLNEKEREAKLNEKVMIGRNYHNLVTFGSNPNYTVLSETAVGIPSGAQRHVSDIDALVQNEATGETYISDYKTKSGKIKDYELAQILKYQFGIQSLASAAYNNTDLQAALKDVDTFKNSKYYTDLGFNDNRPITQEMLEVVKNIVSKAGERFEAKFGRIGSDEEVRDFIYSMVKARLIRGDEKSGESFYLSDAISANKISDPRLAGIVQSIIKEGELSEDDRAYFYKHAFVKGYGLYDRWGDGTSSTTTSTGKGGRGSKKVDAEAQKEYNTLVSEELNLKKQLIDAEIELQKLKNVEGKTAENQDVKDRQAEIDFLKDELDYNQKRKKKLIKDGAKEDAAKTAADDEKLSYYARMRGYDIKNTSVGGIEGGVKNIDNLTPEEQADYWSQYERALDKQARAEEEITGLRNKAVTTTYHTEKDLLYQIADAKERGLATDRANVAMLEKIVGKLDPTRLANIKEQVALNKQLYKLQALKQTRGATSIWDVMANDIRRATMRVADFGIAAKILNKIPQDIQKVIQYTKELDAAMTNIRIVGGYNEEQAKVLMRSYTELGETLGATTVEVATAANEWLRQGYEASDQLEELISASTKLSKLGMISASEATTALTAALKSFNLTAEDAIKVVDKLTKVDQLAAVSAGGISTALQKSATSAKLAGMSMDELIGSVSVIGEVTQQSMDTVGHAMKSILARYGNVKASVFTQMGLNDDGETSENINDIEKVLSKLGIRMRSSSTELRDITDVLDEVNEKWDTYDTVTKNALATAFGGTRMRENFLVLMENWNRVKELTEESANAAGTADEKYSAYMDSMEAATKRLQNAWEGFTQSLETSTVMKFLTNATALLLENMDKFKLVITGIAAANSARIFDFFTNKGEVGGWKGLVANIPFIGRGTKTNNILESIDKKVGNIEKGVGVDSLANQTKNGGFFRRIGGFLKIGFGRGDIYDPKTGKSVSYSLLKKYQKLRNEEGWMPVSQMEAYSKLLKQRQIGNAAMGATSAVLTSLLTNKQVGTGIGGWFGKLFTGNSKNEQTIEETFGDKALRTIASGGLAALGGAFFGPLGAIFGQILGEGFAGMFATWFHRDELEMKQRVVDAKENLKALTSINNSVSENSSLMKESFLDSSGVKNLSKYVDELSEKLGELSNDALSEFLSTVSTSTEKFKTISDLSNYILEANAEERKEIQQRIEVATAKEQLKQTIASQEEERNKIKTKISPLTFQGNELDLQTRVQGQLIDDSNTKISGEMQKEMEKYAVFGDISEEYAQNTYNKWLRTSGALTFKGKTAGEILENAKKFQEIFNKIDISKFSKFDQGYYKTQQKIIDDYIKELADAAKAQDELDSALIKSRVQVAFFQANLSDLTQSELQNLTIDGVAGKVVEALEKDDVAVRDLSGTIKDDYLTQIKLAIKSDEDLYSQLQTDTKSIGELMEIRSKFVQQFGENYDKVREDLDKGKLDHLSDDLKGLIYSADPERIKQFAQAWHMATSEVENFAKRFPNLNTATGLMSVDEVKDKYTKIAEIFSDISQDRTLSIENFENILKNYPEYLSKIGDYEGLMGSLIRSIGEESAEAYKNALFTDIMSSANYLAEFKKTLSEKDVKTIEDAGAKSFEDIYQLAQGKEELRGITEALDEYLNKVIEVENESPLKNFMIELKSGLLDEEINNLNEQKDALSKINDERKKEIEYIKAKYALEDARKEKKRVFRAGVGWTFESDEAAISEAKEKVDSLDLERQQESLQYQIDSLEQQKEILEAIKNNEQLKKIEEALGANGISTDTADIAMMLAQSLKLDLGGRTKSYKTALFEKAKGLEKDVDTALQAYQTALDKFTKGDEKGRKWEDWNQAERKNKLDNLSILYSDYQKAYDAAQSFGVKNMERWSEDGKIISNAAESDKYSIDRIVVNGLGRHVLDWFKDDIKLRVGDKEFAAELSNSNMTVTQKELNEAYGQAPAKGDIFSHKGKYYVYRGDEWWEVLNDKGGTKFYEYMTGTPSNASGTTSFPGGQTLINELGTEAVITPGGTLTALPSKTGIVPADITRNVWTLGEVAPTLIARLSSLTQKPLAGNGANTTYEEGQYIDNLTMNVYPAKGDDFNKILEQARAQVRLTRRNN